MIAFENKVWIYNAITDFFRCICARDMNLPSESWYGATRPHRRVHLRCVSRAERTCRVVSPVRKALRAIPHHAGARGQSRLFGCGYLWFC